MISRLRKALGQSAGSIETTATGYRLVEVVMDVDEVDEVDEVEEMLRAAVEEADPTLARKILERAGGRWPGPTLDGLDGDLVEAEQLRLDNLLANTEELVLERTLAFGAGPGLIGVLEAAVAKQPLREKRWELLMLALYRNGRQADVLRTYQRARVMLSESLGLEPGPALVRLEQRVLAQDPALDAMAATDREDATSARSALPEGTLSLLLCDVEGSMQRWEPAPTDTRPTSPPSTTSGPMSPLCNPVTL